MGTADHHRLQNWKPCSTQFLHNCVLWRTIVSRLYFAIKRNWAKFWAQLPNFPKFFQIWAKMGSNLGKLWKIDPFIYAKIFIGGYSNTKRLILLPMLAAHPRRVFCTEYPTPWARYLLASQSTCRLFFSASQETLQANNVFCHWCV